MFNSQITYPILAPWFYSTIYFQVGFPLEVASNGREGRNGTFTGPTIIPTTKCILLIFFMKKTNSINISYKRITPSLIFLIDKKL